MRISIYLTFLLSLMSLAGCGIGGHWMTGDPSAGKNVKPYGAHWVKEGLTRESRRADFMACGGAQDLREGYPIKPEETIQQFFAGRREHINHVLLPCMQSKGYVYQHQCDERCLHP